MVEIPAWMLGLIATGIGAVVVYVLRGFFLEPARTKQLNELQAGQLTTNTALTEVKTELALMRERFGTVKAQVDAVEKRSDSQATAHNNAMQSLRGEILGRVK